MKESGVHGNVEFSGGYLILKKRVVGLNVVEQ